MKIEKYPHNKWLDKWVTYNNGKKFEWLISKEAPFIKYKMDVREIKNVINSGLSISAKVVFSFLMYNRFGGTPACLYGNGHIAKKIGVTEKTVKRALDELVTCSIIGKAKIHTGKNVSYQYYFLPYKEWALPSNKYELPETKEFLERLNKLPEEHPEVLEEIMEYGEPSF